jgi:hypothetical protein
MSNAGYTYILRYTGKPKTCVAAPRFSVKVGNKLAVAVAIKKTFGG